MIGREKKTYPSQPCRGVSGRLFIGDDTASARAAPSPDHNPSMTRIEKLWLRHDRAFGPPVASR